MKLIALATIGLCLSSFAGQDAWVPADAVKAMRAEIDKLKQENEKLRAELKKEKELIVFLSEWIASIKPAKEKTVYVPVYKDSDDRAEARARALEWELDQTRSSLDDVRSELSEINRREDTKELERTLRASERNWARQQKELWGDKQNPYWVPTQR